MVSAKNDEGSNYMSISFCSNMFGVFLNNFL